MKVLVLTVSTGEGHNCAANAISDMLEARGAECKVLDALYYFNKLVGNTVSCGYLLSIDSMSLGYSAIYGLVERRSPSRTKLAPSRIFASLVAGKLKKYIDEFSPDAIVCTHIFAAMPIEVLKEEGKLKAKTYGVVTDFTIHPYWEELKKFDHIVIPSERLGWQGAKKGFSPKQLLPFGIPLRSGFEGKTDKTEAKSSLGLIADKPLVMVMGGSMGYGDIYRNVRNIDNTEKDFQMVVICGSNRSAYKKLLNASFKHYVQVMGYTDKIPLIMDAADCIVTKPGGITVSEALAKGVPLLLTKPIPGHEERNMSFLTNTGAAMGVTSKCRIEELVWQFFSSQDCAASMRKTAEAIGSPDAAKKLADFILADSLDQG